MILLDTDHISVLQHPDSPPAAVLSARLQDSVDRDIVTTAVTMEEQMRGWLALLNRHRGVRQQADFYEYLIDMVRFFNDWSLLGFDELSEARFETLRHAGIRIGSSDLKIACIALEHDALLLTCNRQDFEKVTGLRFEDWTHE